MKNETIQKKSPWKPISTAPKKGEVIDAYCPNYGRQPESFYKNGTWFRWSVNEKGDDFHVCLRRVPTHWMEPPEDPKEG